jgi:hypothetical protein
MVHSNTTIEDAAVCSVEMRAWLVGELLKSKAAFGPRLRAAAEAAASNLSEADGLEPAS